MPRALRAVAGSLIAGEEEARRRLARELHDDHGQRLAALAFELGAVRHKLPENDPRRSDLDAVAAHLAELGEDLRRLSHDLHPAVLEHRGLAEALRDYCGELGSRYSLPVDLDLRDGAGPLPSEIALGLYRIVQEALTNAARHAGARQARVTLSVAADTVHLAVADDGAGFDPAAARLASGLGLASIEERTLLLGGRCRIASAPGAGTEVEISVPLPAPETALSQLRDLMRRHRRWVVSAVLVILALAGGLVATSLQARRAEREAMRADAVARFLEEVFEASDPRLAKGEPPDARELLRRGTERLATELSGQPLVRARLLDTLGGIYTEMGLFDEARPLLEEALALRERLRGGEHPEVAATLVRLGALAHLSGKGEAEPLFRRALAIREVGLGPDRPEVAEVLNKLGAALAARGRFDEAEATLRRALALEERLWGKDDPRVAKVVHNLSGIAYYRGRTEEAEQLLERALTIREKALAEDDPDLAGSREALALLRQKQGRPAEAAALLERLQATAERVYGPEHPYLAKTLLNLGLARQDLGEDTAARRLLERAVAITDATLAPDHPQHVRALATLAALHLEHRRYAEAEPLFRRLLALHEAGAPFDRWDQTLDDWARLLAATGRQAEAARVEAGTATR